MTKAVILSSYYFGNIQIFSHIVNSDCIVVEQNDHYSRQSYRNRTTIMAANGSMNLIVPVVKPKGKTQTKDILIRGREVHDQINILGDDGVPLDYHDRFWKAEVIDFVILQQDAFDKIDAMTPIARQRFMLDLVLKIYGMEFQFESFEEVATYFKRIINQLKQLNYSEYESDDFKNILSGFDKLIEEKRIM